MTKNKGKFYSIGTGPGDPGLLTLKAVETLKTCKVIAVPDSGASENVVLGIVKAHLEDQRIVCCDMPMTRDKDLLEASHERAATILAAYLEAGENVGFLTLGDPTIYSTALYVHQQLSGMGYDTEVIPGVPSFCAAAAKLNVPLCEGGEMLHVVPASYSDLEGGLSLKGSIVLMKSGKSAAKVKALLDGRRAMAVERCGLSGEKVHEELSTWTEDASYFSVLLVKGEKS
jgi:precorrin-2/cobalt-factor-2 C20-methyltransferase